MARHGARACASCRQRPVSAFPPAARAGLCSPCVSRRRRNKPADTGAELVDYVASTKDVAAQRALDYLAHDGEGYPRTVADVAGAIGLSATSARRALEQLVAQRLVKLDPPNAYQPRAPRIFRLTAAGAEAAVQRGQALARGQAEQFVSGLEAGAMDFAFGALAPPAPAPSAPARRARAPKTDPLAAVAIEPSQTEWGWIVEAIDKRSHKLVGRLQLHRSAREAGDDRPFGKAESYAPVMGIWVAPGLPRRALEARLHEVAAQLAAQSGYPLASPADRTRKESAFWRRQEEKRRASFERFRGAGKEPGASRYVLKHPPPQHLNPDEDLRRLERAAALGDPQAAARLHAARTRAPAVDPMAGLGPRAYVRDVLQAAGVIGPTDSGDLAGHARGIRAVLAAAKVKGVSVRVGHTSVDLHSPSGAVFGGPTASMLNALFGRNVAADRTNSVHLYVWHREDRSDMQTDYWHPGGPSIPAGMFGVYVAAYRKAPKPAQPKELFVTAPLAGDPAWSLAPQVGQLVRTGTQLHVIHSITPKYVALQKVGKKGQPLRTAGRPVAYGHDDWRRLVASGTAVPIAAAGPGVSPGQPMAPRDAFRQLGLDGVEIIPGPSPAVMSSRPYVDAVSAALEQAGHGAAVKAAYDKRYVPLPAGSDLAQIAGAMADAGLRPASGKREGALAFNPGLLALVGNPSSAPCQANKHQNCAGQGCSCWCHGGTARIPPPPPRKQRTFFLPRSKNPYPYVSTPITTLHEGTWRAVVHPDKPAAPGWRAPLVELQRRGPTGAWETLYRAAWEDGAGIVGPLSPLPGRGSPRPPIDTIEEYARWEQLPNPPAAAGHVRERIVAMAEAKKLAGFDAAAARFRQFHGAAPRRVRLIQVPGGPGGQHVVVGMGPAPEIHYLGPPKGRPSNKAGVHWVHATLRGREPLLVLHPNTRGVMTVLPRAKSKTRVTDWIHD